MDGLKRVGALSVGTLFQIETLVARVVRSNDCRTLVQIAGKHARTIRTSEGTEIEFEAPGAKISISPNSMVALIAEDDDDDDLTGVGPSTAPLKSSKGFKPAAATLIRPLNPAKKIGKVLAWLISGTEHNVDHMAQMFGITRGCSMSYLSVLCKEYGIGYVLINDDIKVTLPVGCDDPFKKG